MFVRVKTIVQDGRSYEYLQIVRSVRDGGRVRQELVASLGRRDLLVATGKLDQLVQALGRFSTRLKVVEAARDERFVARQAQGLGVCGRLMSIPLGRVVDRRVGSLRARAILLLSHAWLQRRSCGRGQSGVGGPRRRRSPHHRAALKPNRTTATMATISASKISASVIARATATPR